MILSSFRRNGRSLFDILSIKHSSYKTEFLFTCDNVKLVDSDLKKLNLNMEYEEIESMNVEFFKNMVKKKVK